MQKLDFTKIEKKYNYNFYEDGVTQSMIHSFLQCPYQCKLNYVDGYIPKGKPDYFVFGDCFHYVIERVLQNGVLPTEIQIDNYINQWYEESGVDSGLESYELNDLIVKVKAVVVCYWMKHPTDVLKDWYALELEFNVPYQFDDGVTTRLRGKIDMIEKLKDGTLALYDNKTTSSWSKEQTLFLLPVDLQLNFYLYVLSQQEVVSEVYYNVVKKPTHKRTKLNDEQYFLKLKNHYMEDLDKYYYRESVKINSTTVEEWKENQLDPILKRMREWYDSNYTWPGYYNPTTLENKYGLSAYARLVVYGNEAGYVRREKLNMELE